MPPYVLLSTIPPLTLEQDLLRIEGIPTWEHRVPDCSERFIFFHQRGIWPACTQVHYDLLIRLLYRQWRVED